MWYEGNLEHSREVPDETRKFFEDNEHIVSTIIIEEPISAEDDINEIMDNTKCPGYKLILMYPGKIFTKKQTYYILAVTHFTDPTAVVG